MEALAREEKMEPSLRKELRLEKSLPIINEFGKWMVEELNNHHILPKSQIGKAFRYSLDRWDQLSAYLHDGILEIDNNLVENAIRPVALGLKYTLENILTINHKNLRDLYPQNYKKMQAKK